MQVEFVPSITNPGDELGSFRFDVSDCLSYLNDAFEKYGIPSDGKLLNWLRQISANELPPACTRIPAEFDERTRYFVVHLLETHFAIDVECRACHRTIALNDLSKKEWDDSSTVADFIRVGTSGFKVTCPFGHDLLFIVTKVY